MTESSQSSSPVTAHRVQPGLKRIDGVKNVIAVASGKGGVGKSSVAIHLALALQKEGATVGLLDADIYGPSQPHMLGEANTQPDTDDGKHLEPVMAFGLQTMSIGYLIDNTTPMVWRGPMVTTALLQLAFDTRWRNLDYLIIDMPPGTGDIQLTLAQKIPTSGVVVVTTPQPIALLDVRKAITMLEKVRVPILGIVENMSTHTCESCGHTETIFGSDGAEHIANEYHIPLLGKLPLHKYIREQLDAGTPLLSGTTTHPLDESYLAFARNVAIALSQQAKDVSHKFPTIVVENA